MNAAWLKRKVGGLPVGVWLLIIVAGIGVGLYVRKRAVDPVASDSESVDEEGYVEGDASADVVPMDSLPSEDYGYYPMSGGGPPSVYGGGAIRLQPDTLRIKVQYPRRHRKKHHHHHKGSHRRVQQPTLPGRRIAS